MTTFGEVCSLTQLFYHTNQQYTLTDQALLVTFHSSNICFFRSPLAVKSITSSNFRFFLGCPFSLLSCHTLTRFTGPGICQVKKTEPCLLWLKIYIYHHDLRLAPADSLSHTVKKSVPVSPLSSYSSNSKPSFSLSLSSPLPLRSPSPSLCPLVQCCSVDYSGFLASEMLARKYYTISSHIYVALKSTRCIKMVLPDSDTKSGGPPSNNRYYCKGHLSRTSCHYWLYRWPRKGSCSLYAPQEVTDSGDLLPTFGAGSPKGCDSSLRNSIGVSSFHKVLGKHINKLLT